MSKYMQINFWITFKIISFKFKIYSNITSFMVNKFQKQLIVDNTYLSLALSLYIHTVYMYTYVSKCIEIAKNTL